MHGKVELEQKIKWYLENIKDSIEEANPLLSKANLFNDILSHSLAWVNYQEIAKGFLEE